MCSWPQGGEGSPTLVGLHQDTSEGEPSFQDLHVGDSFNIPTLRAQEGLTLPRGGIVDVPVLGHWLDRGRDPQVWGLRDVEPLTFEGLSPSARHTPLVAHSSCTGVFISLYSQEKGGYRVLRLGQRKGRKLSSWTQFPHGRGCFLHNTKQFLGTSILPCN